MTLVAHFEGLFLFGALRFVVFWILLEACKCPGKWLESMLQPNLPVAPENFAVLILSFNWMRRSGQVIATETPRVLGPSKGIAFGKGNFRKIHVCEISYNLARKIHVGRVLILIPSFCVVFVGNFYHGCGNEKPEIQPRL